jgi:SAM-dependent methyltransferase
MNARSRNRLFASDEESHQHSLETLQLLEKYEDFMQSVSVVYDMGCGAGFDTQWWATQINPRTERPYNIQCYALDIDKRLKIHLRDNLKFVQGDFEQYDPGIKADLIWSHDSFRFSVNPLTTLKTWNKQLNPGGAIILITPQSSIKDDQGVQHPRTLSYSYFNYNITNLMYMLAVAGFDCRTGHFYKKPNDPWIYSMVYKTNNPELDPKNTSLGDLVDLNVLPDSAVVGIKTTGEIRQEDIFTHWISGHYCRWSQV